MKGRFMPSPFSGMDPYLEGEMWQEFHERLANQMGVQLMPLLSPRYVALLAKRYVLQSADLGIVGIDSPRVIYPDVHLAEIGKPAMFHEGPAGTAVAQP